mgnify:CR=1 FL=1
MVCQSGNVHERGNAYIMLFKLGIYFIAIGIVKFIIYFIKKMGIKNAENSIREIQNPEKEYYIQSYTCESGKAAKFIIPEDATEDDLLAFCDMLDIVLKRKFKIKMAE